MSHSSFTRVLGLIAVLQLSSMCFGQGVFLRYYKTTGGAAPTGVSCTGAADRAYPGSAIQDVQFGTNNATTIGSASAGAGAGKAAFAELVIEKAIDDCTPQLFKVAATGAHFDQLTVTFVGAPAAGKVVGDPIMVINLYLAYITSQSVSGGPGDLPTETLKIAYGAMSMAHTPSGVSASWNQVTNKESVVIP